MHTSPVADNDSGEAPTLTEHIGKQHLIIGTPFAVHFIIGSHHAPGISLTDSHLKGFQINLVHGHKAPIVLLIVQGIVFQAGGCSRLLTAFCVSHSQKATEQRVFTEIFIGTTSRGNTLDVNGRTQDHVFSAKTGLNTHTATIGIGHFRTPGGSKCRTRREESGRVCCQIQRLPTVRLHFLTDTERTVSILNVGNA